MYLAGLIPTEAIIGNEDGRQAETVEVVVPDNSFAPGSDEKTPGFGTGYIAMADVDPGRPADIFYYICEPDLPGNRLGKADADLPWGDPFGGFYNPILIDGEGQRP